VPEKVPLGGGKVRVTFRFPATPGTRRLSVCGEFNGWEPAACPMTRAGDGSWSAAVTLDAGRIYAYRFCDDHGTWHDDPAPDAVAPNGLGGVNALADLRSL